MKFKILGIFAAALALLAVGQTTFGQKTKPAAKPAKPIIFAVLDDGRTVEPIAYVNKGKLEAPVNGADDANIIAAFNKNYYRTGSVYRLIFGGANSGSVTIKSSDAKAECTATMATVVSKPAKTPLKGFVMALATNAPIANKSASFRRKPTTAEKAEIDALVKAVFVKEKLTPKVLRYHNLTALDVNNDGTPEFVGSYWIEIDRLTRGLVFLIAEKGSDGKYDIGYREYRSIDQESTMSGDIKNVDEGVYHELLLDVFDVDGDGTAEIFTYVESFEGAGFNVYRSDGGKWANIFEGSNYHCGY